MPTKIEKDIVSGQHTTGHEWDGLQELDTPMPKWWVYVFLATIVFAVVYCVLYPSIPLGKTYFHGILGYSTRAEAMAGVKEMQAKHGEAMAKIDKTPIADIQKDPHLLETALEAGKITFANNCQPCHGPGGEGRPGFPPLNTDFWLWGGTLNDIQKIVTHGIRSSDPDALQSQMPNFGTDGILQPQQIQQVADYVSVALFGNKEANVDTAPGQKIFADNCAVCHGDKGQGNRDVGAPPLASKVHLYGGDRDMVVAQVTHPRHGVMPNWNARLDAATIKSVALYVHSLGGGE